jgi:ActR/RegA family two-component response regulator
LRRPVEQRGFVITVEQTHLLFVDDEESIRITLPRMLESYGFLVTSAGSVAEALQLIARERFDVLIADLNIGNPGDGFTIVSAMRRTQPKAVTFILTGYPAIETALAAIREQVDDYLVKPTEIELLVEKIRAKLAQTKSSHRIQPQRLALVIEQNREVIVRRWLKSVKKDLEIDAIALSDAERQDHVPQLLQVALRRMRGKETRPEDREVAVLHGSLRLAQGYTIPLMIREAKLLERCLGEGIQQNLLAIEVSHLIPDMIELWDTIYTELETSVRVFLEKRDQAARRNAGSKKKIS